MSGKELIIGGGANGAGKTTFAAEYASLYHCVYLGADAIATELASDAPELVAVAAGEELLRRIAAALAGEQRIVLVNIDVMANRNKSAKFEKACLKSTRISRPPPRQPRSASCWSQALASYTPLKPGLRPR
jgi:hypothetical protein